MFKMSELKGIVEIITSWWSNFNVDWRGRRFLNKSEILSAVSICFLVFLMITTFMVKLGNSTPVTMEEMCYHEAGNQKIDGKIYVVLSVLWRMEKRNLTAEQVISQPYQYSFFEDGKSDKTPDVETLKKCVVAIVIARLTKLKGVAPKVTHYHADYCNPFPFWANELEFIAKIGQHLFYK